MCHANLTLGEDHDDDCDFAEKPWDFDPPDPYAEEAESTEETW